MSSCPALPGPRFPRLGLALLAALLAILPARGATPANPGGLTLTFTASGGATDTLIAYAAKAGSTAEDGAVRHVAQFRRAYAD